MKEKRSEGKEMSPPKRDRKRNRHPIAERHLRRKGRKDRKGHFFETGTGLSRLKGGEEKRGMEWTSISIKKSFLLGVKLNKLETEKEKTLEAAGKKRASCTPRKKGGRFKVIGNNVPGEE